MKNKTIQGNEPKNEPGYAGKREDWQIRPLTEADIEAYLDIYLNSYPAYKSLDAECRQHYREKHLLELREDREVKTVGLFEKDTLIATMKLVGFSMNFFGRMQPACGLMALEVHPLHKRKGAALAMVRYFEAYAKENGALLTLLLPFRIDFYRKMGYGFACKLYEYHLPTAVLPKPESEALSHLRLMQPEDFEEALACYNRFAGQNHGMVEKFEEELRGSRGDIQVRRIGYYDTRRRLCGYAAYRFVSTSDTNYTQNCLSVEELVYDNGRVLRALLGALRMQEDLAQTVILRTGEENFHHLLSDPQDISKNYIDFGFLQTNVSAIGTMFKITDPEAFVQKTGYRDFPDGRLTAEFRYFDEMQHAAQSVRILFAEGSWQISGTEKPDVVVHCSQGELASLLMGSADLGALIRLGAVTVSGSSSEPALECSGSASRQEPGTDVVQQLIRMLYCSRKPWLNADY